MNPTMNETEFHQLVDAALTRIEASFDELDADIDAELSAGILTLSFEDGSKVIVNRQTPNREIWVAAKSGGFHFKLVADMWRDTRSDETLDALLSRVVSAQSGESVLIAVGG
jgi:CyaY protein